MCSLRSAPPCADAQQKFWFQCILGTKNILILTKYLVISFLTIFWLVMKFDENLFL